MERYTYMGDGTPAYIYDGRECQFLPVDEVVKQLNKYDRDVHVLAGFLNNIRTKIHNGREGYDE